MYGATVTEKVPHTESDGGHLKKLQEHGSTSHKGVDHATKDVIGASLLLIFCKCVFQSLPECTPEIIRNQVTDDSSALGFDN